MDVLIRIVAPILVAFHGLIHLFGTVVYLQLAEIQGFPYKTTVLNGTVEFGETGIAIFGILWAVAAVGFVVSALGMFSEAVWSLPVLAAATTLSLALTGLDFVVASTGVVVDVTIAVILLLTRTRRRAFRKRRPG